MNMTEAVANRHRSAKVYRTHGQCRCCPATACGLCGVAADSKAAAPYRKLLFAKLCLRVFVLFHCKLWGFGRIAGPRCHHQDRSLYGPDQGIMPDSLSLKQELLTCPTMFVWRCSFKRQHNNQTNCADICDQRGDDTQSHSVQQNNNSNQPVSQPPQACHADTRRAQR